MQGAATGDAGETVQRTGDPLQVCPGTGSFLCLIPGTENIIPLNVNSWTGPVVLRSLWTVWPLFWNRDCDVSAIIPDWIAMPICSPKSGKIALSPQCNCWQSLWIGLRCLQAVFNLGKMPSFHNGTDEVFTLETNCDVLAVLFGTEWCLHNFYSCGARCIVVLNVK